MTIYSCIDQNAKSPKETLPKMIFLIEYFILNFPGTFGTIFCSLLTEEKLMFKREFRFFVHPKMCHISTQSSTVSSHLQLCVQEKKSVFNFSLHNTVHKKREEINHQIIDIRIFYERY